MGRVIMRYTFLLFAFFISASLFSQTQVSGKVQAASGENLPGASLILKDSIGKIISYCVSGEGGKYNISTTKKGNFLLEANFLGYKKQSLPLTIKGNKTIILDVILDPSAEVLKEVVIEYEQPVKLKGDTLVYDAKALAKGTEVVVEDLLKNIPGINIAKDGTIYFGDRPIEKVMVDGDDLFNKGYSLLTRNMPSKPLDKVEVLQNYSNNKLLKGIEDSKAVALNLTVQDEYKNLWFGDLMAGYGIEERYIVSGNLMNFGEKIQGLFYNFLK